MSPTPTIAPALLDTILGPLVLLFLTGAGGDPAAARDAANQMLAAYNAETPEELRLAAEIVTFSLHALEALRQAAEAGLSPNKILRLRGSAVSLSRESHKAQRKLDQLQRARGTAATQKPAESAAAPTPTGPETGQAIGLIEFAKQAIQAAGKDNGVTWTKAFQQRQTAKRMTENLKKNQARHQAQAAMAG